jgi:hypothetical protein
LCHERPSDVLTQGDVEPALVKLSTRTETNDQTRMKRRGTNTSGVVLRALGRISGLKRNEAIEVRRKLHNLCSSPSKIGTTESRRMRWVGNVVQIGEKSIEYILWVGKLASYCVTWTGKVFMS